MAVQQRACGHLVPASMVRCPTCGATIGAPVHEQPEKVAARNRPIVAVMVLAVVACTALIGVLAVVIVRNRPEPLPRHRVGDGWIAGTVVPLEDVGLRAYPGDLPVLEGGRELRFGPPRSKDRVRITDDASGISLAPFLKTTLVHPDGQDAQAPGSCGRLAWYAQASRGGYVEDAELCVPKVPVTARALLQQVVTVPGSVAGTWRTLEVDGHPAVSVTTLSNGDREGFASGDEHIVRSHVMVDTGKGMLHLSVEAPLVEEGGAPDPMPFVGTVRIP